MAKLPNLPSYRGRDGNVRHVGAELFNEYDLRREYFGLNEQLI